MNFVCRTLTGMTYSIKISSFFSLLLLYGCQASIDYNGLTAVAASGNLQAVIEVPAGASSDIVYNKKTGEFEQVLQGDGPQVINFLPYPGNYGFVPGLQTNGENGGAKGPFKILVVGHRLETGTVLEVIPLGILLLREDGIATPQIIAVPADEGRQTLKARNFLDFLIQHDAAKRMIEDWFAYHRGWGRVEVDGWEDDQYVWKEVNKYR